LVTILRFHMFALSSTLYFPLLYRRSGVHGHQWPSKKFRKVGVGRSSLSNLYICGSYLRNRQLVVKEAGVRGCKFTPKSFGLSKIRARSLKIWAKMAPNVVWIHKNEPNVCRRTHEEYFCEGHTKKVFMIFVGKICRQSRTKTFQASLGTFGQ